jgi:hypothetical protein
MQTVDARAISAARYWASRPGNWAVFRVFDEEDARQSAALALVQKPDATWAMLYRRVLEAVARTVPGYRQRNILEWSGTGRSEFEADDGPSPYHVTLQRERAALLDALPEEKRALAVHWIDGEEDKDAGARYGVKGPAWCWRRRRLFNELQQRGL